MAPMTRKLVGPKPAVWASGLEDGCEPCSSSSKADTLQTEGVDGRFLSQVPGWRARGGGGGRWCRETLKAAFAWGSLRRSP